MTRVLGPEGAHARSVRSLVDLRGPDVLEVGCGEGRLTSFDSGADVVDDIAGRGVTRMPPALGAELEQIVAPLVERSFCLLRRLRVRGG